MFNNKVSAVIAVAIILYACSNEKQKAEKIESFSVATPIKKDTIFNKQYVAEIQAIKNIEIRSKVKGFIEKIHIDEGSFVREGQLLFSISSKEFSENLLKTKAQLKSELAQQKSLEVELKNVRNLYSKNIVSKTEVELAEAKVEASEAKCDELKADISLAQLQVSYSQIKAPFSGYINRIPLKTGSLIEEGDLLTTLSDNNEIFAYFKVSETEYLNFSKSGIINQTKSVALLLADNSMHQEKGAIETVDGEIEKSTGNISFRARFKNPKNIVKHGATGKIIIPFNLNEALLIPMSATFEIQENFYVYIVNKENKLILRRVFPSLTIGKFYVVDNGLEKSDRILLEGIQLVKNGQIIKVKN